MASTKSTFEYLDRQIRDICEDISLYGVNAPAYLYVSRKTGNIIDYMPEKADDGKVLYIDEEQLETTLFNVLWNYIAALMAQMNRSFTKAGVWITSARLALGLTMEQFAAECDVSVISVSSWERGVRMPKVEKLIRFAKAHDLPIDPLI